MFEICLIGPSGRSSFLKRDTLFDARETAREAVALIRCEVEIVDRETGNVVERREPPSPTLRGELLGTPDPGQRQMMARELRRKAALARSAASIPTSGSARVDRVLVLLAERLELRASCLEAGTRIRACQGGGTSRRLITTPYPVHAA
jgi:hypothetical protein